MGSAERDEAHVGGEFEIAPVGEFVELLVRRELVTPEAFVGDIGVELVRIDRAAPVGLSPSSPRQPASGPMPGARSWLTM